MGKANCKDNKELSHIYNFINKAVNELGKAKKRAKSPEGKRALQRTILACQKAVIQLFKMQQHPSTTLSRMQEGD